MTIAAQRTTHPVTLFRVPRSSSTFRIARSIWEGTDRWFSGPMTGGQRQYGVADGRGSRPA
jgi:hypothetical protein